MRSRFDRLWRVAPGAVFYLTVGIVLVLLSQRPDKIAQSLHLDLAEHNTTILIVMFFLAMAAFLIVAYKLIGALVHSGRDFAAWRKRTEPNKGFAEAGVVMVEFALLAPTVWLVMAMTVQLALLAEASLVVRYAAFAAARSAVVRLERDSLPYIKENLVNPDKVRQTAALVLCSLSPKKSGTTNTSAKAMRDAFAAQNGVWGDKNFHQRYDYAYAATTLSPAPKVESPPFDIFSISLPAGVDDFFAPSMVTVTIQYKYWITIPGLTVFSNLIAPNGGKAFPLTGIAKMQGTGARQSNPMSIFAGGFNPMDGFLP